MEEERGTAPDGYRLPGAAHVGTVRLQVSELMRSLAFYVDLLGMTVIDRDADVALLGAKDSDSPLLELYAGAEPLSSRRGRLGLYHFAILLPDRPSLGSLLAHLTARGVHPGAADHLVSEALYLQDPDDLGIEIYRDRPSSDWTLRNGELAMATDPLDAAALVAAGGGVSWSGMPAGTTIGHVHLHVGDLAVARAFYHDALGFDIVVSAYPGALFMSAGGYHHHLGVNTWAGPHAAAPAMTEPRLLSWDLVLPDGGDVARVVDRLTAAGFDVKSNPATGSIAHDPWQTPMRVVARRR